MATPNRKKPATSSQDGANRSRGKDQRKSIPSATIMKSQRLSDGTGAQPTRRSIMAAEEIKERAEKMREAGETTAEDLRRTGEEFTKAASTFDLKGMSNAWKQGYLRGLEAFFQSQEQTEHLLKEMV